MTTANAVGPRRATIAAIAEEAGVSVATVSKVLNGRGDVAAETRTRVEASLERNRYRRRGKRQPPSTGHIELVFHTLGADWEMEIIHGVQAVSGPAKVAVVLSHLDGRSRPSRCDSTTATLAGPETACTPWMISISQSAPSVWKTSSMCPVEGGWRLPRRR